MPKPASKPLKVERDFRPLDYDFEEWLLHQLVKAFYEARKGKRRTKDEYNFEAYWLENLSLLEKDIYNRRYKPSRGIAFITRRPVIREIFAAPFRDRIVHHFLYNQCADWWDKRFIYDAYSCRKDKGTLMGIKRLEHHICAVSHNYSRPAYVIKLDIQGYFMSLSRKALFEKIKWGLERQFADDKARRDLLMYLWREVIFDDPIRGVKRRGSLRDWDDLPRNKSLFGQPPGQGIVIGNLSSQLLSNIYLDQLDRFMTYDLGYKHYGRYVDDFYYVVTEDEFKQAKQDIKKIREFLEGLGLTLHPKKIYIQEVKKGVEFLGTVVYPYRTVMGRRFKKHFYEAAMEFCEGRRDLDSLISYLGYTKHFNAKKLTERVFDRMGWRYGG